MIMVAMAAVTMAVGMIQGAQKKKQAKVGQAKAKADAKEQALANAKRIRENTSKQIKTMLYNNAQSSLEMTREAEVAKGQAKTALNEATNKGMGEGSSIIEDIEQKTEDTITEAMDTKNQENVFALQDLKDQVKEANEGNKESLKGAMDNSRKAYKRANQAGNDQMVKSGMDFAKSYAGSDTGKAQWGTMMKSAGGK